MKVIGQRARFGSHLGLERIELLCSLLDNPQEKLKFLHVAGTNGKGSVSAFLAEVLQTSGYRVGLFTSPHLEHYSERFRINGVPIDGESLGRFVQLVEKQAQKLEESEPQLGAVTEFELATAVAFLYFLDAQVDLVVLETGLGGRLDATNVVNPLLSIITTIGHDHTDRLGTSLEEIAREKAGIIKAGVPVISGVTPGFAERVLLEVSTQRLAPWRSTNDVPWQALGWDLSGGNLIFPGWGQVKIGLLGEHQIQNAATALLALQELANLGWQIPPEALHLAMENVRWPGRLEVLSTEPFIILDGGHNEEGMLALVDSLEHLAEELGVDTFTIVFGMLHNKELSLLDPLLPLAKRFIFTQTTSGRLAPMDPEIMAAYVKGKGAGAEVILDVGLALGEASKTSPVCVCGSLYLAGSIKRYLHG